MFPTLVQSLFAGHCNVVSHYKHGACSLCFIGLTGQVHWLNNALQIQVGLQPDLTCVPEVIQAEYWVSGSRDAEDLSQDPCIQMAQDKLTSMQPNTAS